MKPIYRICFLLIALCISAFTAQAQWFNDNMGSTNSGAAPCPWVNSTAACNPPGVVNQGVCVTGSLGGPVWFAGATSTVASYCWAASAAGNTACTFTYTLNVTGTATINAINFQARASSSGATSISTFTINGTPKTPSPSVLPNSAFNAISVPVSPAITISGGTLTIVIGFTGASNSSINWVNRIDDFQISGTTAPIELTEFSAKVVPAGVALNWVTAAERDNDYFSVERGGDDQRFEEIGQVKGSGNSTTLKYYDFMDTKPLVGTNYYRLRQVDFDGKFDYSPVQSVQIAASGAVALLPNPLTLGENPTIYYDSRRETDLYISVFNAMGQQLLENQQSVQKGNNLFPIDLSGLSPGIYTLRIQNGQTLPQVQQFVIN
jgi:hypothetical protein